MNNADDAKPGSGTRIGVNRFPHHSRIAIACLSAALAASCRQSDDRGLAVEGRRSQAFLASASEREISLFGELPGEKPAGYFTRSATSLRQHTFPDVGADFDADIDSTGRRVIFASTRHNTHPDLYVQTIDGVAVTQLTSDPASDIQPAFSPDDSRVAFASNRAGNWDIWMVHAAGGPAVQVTFGSGDEVHPSWSPDGRQLVYCGLPESGGQWELWVADATAGGSRKFIGYGLFPEWSPSGDAIVYQRARERGSRWFSVWTLTLVGGEPRYPTELASSATHAMITPTWSRDGHLIAFASTPLAADAPHASSDRPRGASTRNRSGAGVPPSPPTVDLWIVNADGSGKYLLTDGHTRNFAPVFGPDHRLYFSTDRAGGESIWSLVPESALGADDGAQSASRTLEKAPAESADQKPKTGAARVVKDDL